LGQHHEAGQFWLARAFELLEVVFDENAGQLAGAVGAEVHEDHGVAVFDFTGSPMEVALTNSSLSPRA
jgi:Ni2+-binding GTPase involved in maturation of urease and hydrogenase